MPEASFQGVPSLGTDPRRNHKGLGNKCWEGPNATCCPGVSPGFQETSARWPALTLILSFPCRTESEAPRRPASPKVSRSSPEAATPVEDMARRSKLATGGRRWTEGGKGIGVGNPDQPMFSDSWEGQESRWLRAQVCCLTLWVQIPAL